MKIIMYKKHSLLTQIALCFILMMSSHTHAREYAIEMIFFMHIDGEQITDENFPENLKLVSPNQGIEINNDYPHSKVESSTANEDEQQWRAIPSSDFILNDVVKKLNHSRDYKVLKHIAWQQPIADHKNAQLIKIQGGRDLSLDHPERLPAYPQASNPILAIVGNQNIDLSPPALYELEGTVKVVITRYIHVYADLILHLERFISHKSHQKATVNNDLIDYKIDLHKKMKSRELHYIDHPLIGIIVEATPIEMPEDES